VSTSTPSRSLRDAVTLVAWVAGLVAAWWFLRHPGHTSLAAPPLTSWSALVHWADRRDEAEIVMALLRVVAQGLVTYLLALSMLGAVLRLASTTSSNATDRVTPAWLVRLLDSSLGVGLTVAAGLASVTFPSPVSPPTPVVAHPAEGVRATRAVVVMQPTAGSSATMVPLADDPPVMVPMGIDDRPADADPRIEAAQSSTRERIWVTETGDHLWSIAVDTLTDELEVTPSAAQIDC
jgi:hypothetical protein